MAYCYLDDDYYKITLEIVEDFINLDYIKFINNGYSEKYPKILKMEIVLHLKKLDDIVDIKVRKYFLLNVKRKINKKQIVLDKTNNMEENKRIFDRIEIETKEDYNLNNIKIILYVLEKEKKVYSAYGFRDLKITETIITFVDMFIYNLCYHDLRNSFKYADFYINKDDYNKYLVNIKLRKEEINEYFKKYYENVIKTILRFSKTIEIEKILIAEKNIINHVKNVYDINIDFIAFN